MTSRKFELETIPGVFGIARLEGEAETPQWARNAKLLSVTRTDAELSIICDQALIPDGITAQRGFRCLRVRGALAFEEVGVLLALAGPLASAGISILALSTYDTDYLLVPGADFEAARNALSASGHRFRD